MIDTTRLIQALDMVVKVFEEKAKQEENYGHPVLNICEMNAYELRKIRREFEHYIEKYGVV